MKWVLDQVQPIMAFKFTTSIYRENALISRGVTSSVCALGKPHGRWRQQGEERCHCMLEEGGVPKAGRLRYLTYSGDPETTPGCCCHVMVCTPYCCSYSSCVLSVCPATTTVVIIWGCFWLQHVDCTIPEPL